MKQVTAIVILAGGESRRMGSAKALLTGVFTKSLLPTNHAPENNVLSGNIHSGNAPKEQTLLDFHIEEALKFSGSSGIPILVADNGKRLVSSRHQDKVCAIADYQSAAMPKLSAKSAQNLPYNGGPLAGILGAMNHCECSGVSPMNGYLAVLSCDALVSMSALLSQCEYKSAYEVLFLKTQNRDYPLLGLYALSLHEALRDYFDRGNRRVLQFIEQRIVKKIAVEDALTPMLNINTPEDFVRARSKINAG